MMLDESTNKGTQDILDDIMIRQLGKSETDPSWGQQLYLIHGDQKTVERLRALQRLMSGDYRPWDTKQWYIPILGMWHFKFNYLYLLHEIHYPEQPSLDDSTLQANAAFWNRNRLSKPTDFKHLESLIIHSFFARICAIAIFRLTEGASPRTADQAFHQVAKELSKVGSPKGIVNMVLAWLKTDNYRPGQKKEHQEIWNHLIYLQNTLPYLMLKDGIKYGDIGLLRIAIARLCVMYQGSRHERYANELFHLARYTIISGPAKPELQRAILANSLVNARGERDTHYEKDRQNEFLNRHIKEWKVYNKTSSLPAEELMTKAAQSAPQNMLIGERFRNQLQVQSNSRHPTKSAKHNIRALVAKLYSNSIRP